MALLLCPLSHVFSHTNGGVLRIVYLLPDICGIKAEGKESATSMQSAMAYERDLIVKSLWLCLSSRMGCMIVCRHVTHLMVCSSDQGAGLRLCMLKDRQH